LTLIWVVLLAAGAAALARFLFSPALALSRFEIAGSHRARTRELLAAVSPDRGRNLLTLNLARVAAALEKVAWVDRVTVSKEFPDALKISLVERVPIALRRAGGRLYWLDRTGVVVAPYDPREEAGDYPVITAPDEQLPAAAELLRRIQEEVPQFAAVLSEIWSLPSGGFGMMDTIFRVPIAVSPSDAPNKIRALLSLREEIGSKGLAPRAIDLRFHRRIVLSGVFGSGRTI
jgi:cell division septal protein FtsQ